MRGNGAFSVWYAERVTQRDESIDAFRGLAIVMMVPANYLEHIAVVPPWLKHAPDVGLTVIDFVAPFFMFAIGLTMPGSLRRRFEKLGAQATVEHVLRRGLALIGLGALFSLGETSYGFNAKGIQWGTLQAIGAASMVVAPFVFVKPGIRLVAALVLLVGYQWGLETLWLEQVLASPQAGLPGVLSWSALLMLATIVGDRSPRAVWGLVSLVAGAGLSFVIPLSKHRMSIPFVLITFGAAVVVFLFMRRVRAPAFLLAWGKNPLVMYCAHLVLLGAFLVPEARWWHFEASVGQAMVQFVAYALVLHLIASTLERRKIFVTL